jgi:hypothetical protein
MTTHTTPEARNEWLASLNHEDVLPLIATNNGRCGHGCSTCDTSAFYIEMMDDDGILCGGVVCLRAATHMAKLIAEDHAAGIGMNNSLTRIPTAAQRAAKSDDIGW